MHVLIQVYVSETDDSNTHFQEFKICFQTTAIHACEHYSSLISVLLMHVLIWVYVFGTNDSNTHFQDFKICFQTTVIHAYEHYSSVISVLLMHVLIIMGVCIRNG